MYNTADCSEIVAFDELTHQTSIDQYMEEQTRGRHVSQEWIEQHRRQLQALAISGDQWWYWLSGTEPLMQQGGLALVRAGKIVWARMDWLS